MRPLLVSEVARLAGGALLGPASALVGPLVTTDSRQVNAGALFVALPGEQVNGHAFVGAAQAGGAAAALVVHEVPEVDLAQIIVDDALGGLSRLAHGLVDDAVRAGGLTTLALTGSSGKTTTKDLLSQVLGTDGATVAPDGSLNNEVGVPLTACRIDASTRYLVTEMGARHAGDIAWLCSLVPPQIAAVLNVGTAHLGEFGSRAGIAAVKGEILDQLGPDGWAVLNADDAAVTGLAERTRGRCAWFSAGSPIGGARRLSEAPLGVRAVDLVADDMERYRFRLAGHHLGVGFDEPVSLHQIGRHLVDDALAAATMALAAGLSPTTVAGALSEAVERSPWRMEPHALSGGALLINDAYNANPDSMRAALTTVGRMLSTRRLARRSAKATAVLGDMLELGDQAVTLHREVGQLAARLGIGVLAVGEYAEATAAGALAEGGTACVIRLDEVVDRLELSPGTIALLKASRGMGLPKAELDRRGLSLERLVPVLTAKGGGRAA